MRRGIVGVGEAHRIVCPVVENKSVADRHDPAFMIKPTLHIVKLVAPMCRADEVFRSMLKPYDRPAQLSCEEWDKNLRGIDKNLWAESAADVGRDHTHAIFRNIQLGCDLSSHKMRHLRRRPDGEDICFRLDPADDTAAFQRSGAISMMA